MIKQLKNTLPNVYFLFAANQTLFAGRLAIVVGLGTTNLIYEVVAASALYC